MAFIGVLLPLCMLVYSQTQSAVPMVVASLLSVGGMCLLFHAAFREKAQSDRSQEIPRTTSVTILCVIVVLVLIVFYRAVSG